MGITGEAYGGSMLLPNWTNQSLTSNLEEGTGATSLSSNSPSNSGYLAWSTSPDVATDTVTLTTSYGYLTKVIPNFGGVCTKLDMLFVAVGAPSAAYFAIYSGASFATGPLAYTAESHTPITTSGNGVVYSATWNGASSASYALLQANTPYWIYQYYAATTPTMGGTTDSTAVMLNVNLTASATSANNSMSLSSSPPATVSNTTTLTPQTTWVNFTSKIWYGLR